MSGFFQRPRSIQVKKPSRLTRLLLEQLEDRVCPSKNPPIAINDAFTAVRNQVLVVQTAGVLANDSDPDGDTLSVSAVNDMPASLGVAMATSHGSVTMAANGLFNYTPTADYTGADSFSYTAADGQGGLTDATVTVNVQGRRPRQWRPRRQRHVG